MISFRIPLGGTPQVGEGEGKTDLELIRRAFRPLAERAPWPIRGPAVRLIEDLTHADVRAVYAAAGGEAGIKALAEAIIRIGKGEAVGFP